MSEPARMRKVTLSQIGPSEWRVRLEPAGQSEPGREILCHRYEWQPVCRLKLDDDPWMDCDEIVMLGPPLLPYSPDGWRLAYHVPWEPPRFD